MGGRETDSTEAGLSDSQNKQSRWEELRSLRSQRPQLEAGPPCILRDLLPKASLTSPPAHKAAVSEFIIYNYLVQ